MRDWADEDLTQLPVQVRTLDPVQVGVHPEDPAENTRHFNTLSIISICKHTVQAFSFIPRGCSANYCEPSLGYKICCVSWHFTPYTGIHASFIARDLTKKLTMLSAKYAKSFNVGH